MIKKILLLFIGKILATMVILFVAPFLICFSLVLDLFKVLVELYCLWLKQMAHVNEVYQETFEVKNAN